MEILEKDDKRIIKNIDFKKKKINIIRLSDILKELKLEYIQFVELCILLGSDYCDTIQGIGYNKSYQYMLKYKSITKIMNNIKTIKDKDKYLKQVKLCKKIFTDNNIEFKIISKKKNIKKSMKILKYFEIKKDLISKIL